MSEFFDRRAKVATITFAVFCALLIGLALWGVSCLESMSSIGR